MTSQEFKAKATALIDDLKGVCANYGLGNDGNEFKIITQVFLYKFLNDKFAHEVKRIEPALAKVTSWEDALRKVAQEMVQLHGGIGMTDEHDAGLYLKRAQVADQTWGNAAFHRQRYARLSGL